MGGDESGNANGLEALTEFAPHGRGWIHSNIKRQKLHKSLPLAGGDFSAIYDLRNAPFRFAPRRRGWFVSRNYNYIRFCVCPSYEGISRGINIQIRSLNCFPLAGGDFSRNGKIWFKLPGFATHMSGWLTDARKLNFGWHVCPSYEGMFLFLLICNAISFPVKFIILFL